MKVRVNNIEKDVAGVENVTGLLAALGVDPTKVVVELNGEIVPRDGHDSAAVSQGDKVEIVQFVGGG